LAGINSTSLVFVGKGQSPFIRVFWQKITTGHNAPVAVGYHWLRLGTAKLNRFLAVAMQATRNKSTLHTNQKQPQGIHAPVAVAQLAFCCEHVTASYYLAYSAHICSRPGA